MEHLTSETKKYKCICLDNLISPSELQNHIISPSIHQIRKVSIPREEFNNKEKIFERRNQIKSLKKDSLSDSLALVSNSLESTENVNKSFKILENSYKSYYYGPINTFLQNMRFYGINQSQFEKKINKLLHSPKIKEITAFKFLKKHFKSNFKTFLDDCTTTLTSLFLSVDNSFIMTGGIDGRVRLWDFETLKQKACLFFHHSSVISLDVNRSSRYGISGSHDSNICLWNLKFLKIKTVFKCNGGSVYSIKFCKDDSIIISGYHDKKIRVWDIFQNTIILSINLLSSVKFLSFQQFMLCLFVVCEESEIYKIDLNSNLSNRMNKFKTNLICCCIAEDIQLLVTGNNDGHAQVVSMQTMILLNSFKIHSERIDSIAFCRIDQIFASASNDSTIKLWKALPHKLLRVLNPIFPINCLLFSNTKIISCGLSSQIEVYDIHEEEVFANPSKRFYINSLAISVKLEIIAYGSDRLSTFSLKLMREICDRSFGFAILSLTFKGMHILCGTEVGNIYLLDSERLTVKKLFNFGWAQIYFLRVTNDWKVLAYSTENKLILQDIRCAKQIKTHNEMAEAGQFKENYFVFVDRKWNVYVIENFETISKIGFFQSYLCFWLKSSDKIIMKDEFSRFILKDINNDEDKLYVSRLKEIKNEKDRIISKDVLILSILDFTGFIN